MWSRIWLGIHFPVDVLASAHVGALAGCLARAARTRMDAVVLPLADRPYEGAIAALRLPPGLVPR